LNVIHVAGTKGKGSTCAYVDSMLRAHSDRNKISCKIGLYTSPSLWPRNRIRIDSNPLPEGLFAKRFFEVYKGLSLDSNTLPPDTKTPGYLQMLAILAFHTFIEEGVEVVICEAHHGGQFDATNFVDRPAITAITKIGMDHVENLGRTIQHIAWHKSGIFRDGVRAFSVLQVQEAQDEIERRAEQQGAILQFVGSVKGSLLEILEIDQVEDIPLEQRENCALATEIAHGFLQRSHQSLDRRDVLAGVQKCHWAGRFDIENSGGCTWYLDGAHNETSMEVVAKWYERVASPK
jgi:folylpolyglutamate synthase